MGECQMKFQCAGIVLYNPDLDRLKENFDKISKQVDDIILVDNNSTNADFILKEYSNKKHVSINRNDTNKGIATALNQIAEKAMQLGYDWVLLLDQDSVCSPHIIDSYKKYIADQNIALLTPYIVDINKTSLEEYYALNLPETSSVEWAITSGSLISLRVWNSIGRFSDELFIDAVDIDYSIRLKLNGYKQIRVNKEYLLQEVGRAEPTFIFRPHKDNAGKWMLKRYYRSNHSLLRQYYMTRNNIIVARKYRNYKPLLKSLAFVFAMTFPKIFVEKNKVKLIKAILKGTIDGFKYEVYKYSINRVQ
jgi:rhamnosyltransferase